MAAADSRIQLHRQSNRGIVDALNFGLSFCTSELIAPHDADDLAYSNRLSVQRDYMRDNPDCIAVSAAARHIDNAGSPLGTIAALGVPNAGPFQMPAQEPYLIHPLLMVRRAALEKVGLYRYAHHSEDTDLYWRLFELGRLANLPEVLGDYRIHTNSISGRSVRNGRIMSVNSQLAALSARRRAAGLQDINFKKENMAKYERASTLSAIVEIASEGLTKTERVYLAAASTAKLIELASYRPYDLELEDCRYIGSIARHSMAELDPVNRAAYARRVSAAAARIANSGRLADALQMLPAGLYPKFVARLAARTVLPRRIRQMLSRHGNNPLYK